MRPTPGLASCAGSGLPCCRSSRTCRPVAHRSATVRRLAAADRRRGLHIISVRRSNLLRRYLSYRVMREPKSDPPGPKRLTPDEPQSEFERQEEEVARFDAQFARHPVLRLSYEELCGSYDLTIRRVQAFVGVEPVHLKVGMTPPKATSGAQLGVL